MAATRAWENVSDSKLYQGDYLPKCLVSGFDPDTVVNVRPAQSLRITILGALGIIPKGKIRLADVDEVDLIVVTQSCDLVKDEGYSVLLCRIMPTSEFEKTNEAFKKKGKWEEVKKDRIHGLHLVPTPTSTDAQQANLVIDLREVYALPYPYVQRRATELGPRWRLQSPYREKFSRAFGDLYSRVALP